MFIKEIEINNILGCRSVHLNFNGAGRHRRHIYVVQSEPTCPLRRALSTAVQLICSAKYATIQSLTQLKDIHQGSVRLILLIPKHRTGPPTPPTPLSIPADSDNDNDDGDDCMPTTSKRSIERDQRRQKRQFKRSAMTSWLHRFNKVNAYRSFSSNAEIIEYSVDDGPVRSCSPASFHGKFLITVEYVLPRLGQFQLGRNFQLNGNWLKLFSTELNEKCHRKEDMKKLLEDFNHLFLKKNLDRQHILSKLTSSYLTGSTAVSIIQRTYACKVFQDVRSIFEFITCSEYTVWFLIPYNGQLVDINDALTDNLDFKNMKTCIQLKSKDTRNVYLWSDAEHELQDLLLTAFQLALAFHCKQNIVYLQRLDALKDHHALQLAVASYLQKYENSCDNWNSKNYLQRIIDVCIKIGVTAIIEYPGGLPLAPVNAHTIKCFKENSATGEWNMKLVEDVGEEADTLNNFVTCLEEAIRHRNV